MYKDKKSFAEIRQNIPNRLNKIKKKYSNDCKIDSDFKYDADKDNTNNVDKRAKNFVNKIKLSLQKLKSKKKKTFIKKCINQEYQRYAKKEKKTHNLIIQRE